MSSGRRRQSGVHKKAAPPPKFRFQLCKVTADGDVKDLTERELSSFEADFPHIAERWLNETVLGGSSSGGWQEECRRVLETVMNAKAAIWFKAPVDPVALNLPDYFKIIKAPMDLGERARVRRPRPRPRPSGAGCSAPMPCSPPCARPPAVPPPVTRSPRRSAHTR